MKIKLMDEKLYKYLINEKEESCRVHSVFIHACNLFTSRGLWLTLVSENRWLPPNGVKLNHNKDLRECFPQGEHIRFSIIDQKIKLLDLKLSTSNKKKKETRENKRVKLEYMKTYLALEGKGEAVGKAVLPGNIQASFRCLERALEENSLGKIQTAARGLIGFGSGLTPSMDDYLTGRILMWKAWMMHCSAPMEEDYSKVIEEAARGRTTIPSEWMIRFAGEGRCSEEILHFLHTFFRKSTGAAFDEAFREVLKIGSTSGEDLIYGMCSEGSRLLKRYEGGSSEWD